MRPTLGHTRPFATRYRPAPLVPGSLAWTVAEVYRGPMEKLRDAWRPAIEIFPNGDARINDPAYAPVWSAAEAEMVNGEPVWSERNQRASYARVRAAILDWEQNVAPHLPGARRP